MIYLKDPTTGEIYAYDSPENVSGVGLRPLTDREFRELLNPPPKPPTPEKIRLARDSRIAAVEWRLARARDEASLGIPPTEPQTKLLEYIQALRDVPQQPGFPGDVVWPIEPELPT